MLIYGFLHKYRLPVDKWYDVAAIGYCKAARLFDPARGYRFSTFAYPVMSNAVRQEMKLAKTQKRPKDVISLQTELSDGFTLEQTLVDRKACFEESLTSCMDTEKVLNRFIGSLRRQEKLILTLFNAGKTQMEIGEILGVSQQQISMVIIALRKKYMRFKR